MLIIGCDYHPGFQQIAFVDTETGEWANGDWLTAKKPSSSTETLKQRNVTVRLGMEASGHSRWFERLLRELAV